MDMDMYYRNSMFKGLYGDSYKTFIPIFFGIKSNYPIAVLTAIGYRQIVLTTPVELIIVTQETMRTAKWSTLV